MVLTPLRQVLDDPLVERLVAAVALFLWTPYVLLGRRVPWRLLPTSVTTSGSILIAGVVSAIVMPQLLTNDTMR